MYQEKEDDEGTTDEGEIWQVKDMTEEDLETTEGEEVHLLTTSWSWWDGGERQREREVVVLIDVW